METDWNVKTEISMPRREGERTLAATLTSKARHRLFFNQASPMVAFPVFQRQSVQSFIRRRQPLHSVKEPQCVVLYRCLIVSA
jgi:hypothetical protein